MNRSERLRILQARLDEADRGLKVALGVFDATRDAYDGRRYAPGDVETGRARAAMALASHEWMRALIARETVRDELAAEHRRGGQGDDGEPMEPSVTRRGR